MRSSGNVVVRCEGGREDSDGFGVGRLLRGRVYSLQDVSWFSVGIFGFLLGTFDAYVRELYDEGRDVTCM
jgi:hypothetical protein